MAKMKVENYKKYNNEYVPSWVKPTDDEIKREKKEFEKLVYGDTKKRIAKKKKTSESATVVKKKIASHKGKGSAKKFYAIKNGRKKKVIVSTWSECSKLVLGYQGAIYKGFNTEEEAKAFLK